MIEPLAVLRLVVDRGGLGGPAAEGLTGLVLLIALRLIARRHRHSRGAGCADKAIPLSPVGPSGGALLL